MRKADTIAIVADVHVGNHQRMGGPMVAGVNTRCREVVAVLAEASRIAAESASALVILGDLFDTARPSPQVVRATMDALADGPPTFIALGNHDMASGAPGDHALGPLAALRNVHLVATPTRVDAGKAGLWVVPFTAGKATDWFGTQVPKDGLAGCALGLHAGIIGVDTPWFLRTSASALDAQWLGREAAARGVPVVFAGDWHAHAVHRTDAGVRCVQVGALVPTGWDNPGVEPYGSVILYGGGHEWARTKLPGPRYVTVGSDSTELAVPDDPLAAPLRVRWDVKPGALASALAEVAGHPSVQVGAMEVSVELDGTACTDALVESVAAARTAETFSEALTQYVGAMALEAGVDRDRVRSLAAGMLGVA